MKCNGCKNAKLRKELGDKYLLLGNTVYEYDAAPYPGQDQPLSHNGRSIQFHAWFMEIAHSYDHDCKRLGEGRVVEMLGSGGKGEG